MKKINKIPQIRLLLAVLLPLAAPLAAAAPALAGTTCGGGPTVKTAIDFGCRGGGNPIVDMTFGIIRFLSIGVGIVVVGSIVVAGIQYSSARGNPEAVANAQKRLKSTIGALFLYIFGYAILNYVIPAGFIKK